MAQEGLVIDRLTDDLIDGGEKLVGKLDAMGLPINAAFWFLLPDGDEWRLMIASPEVTARGSRAVYGRVFDAADQSGSVVPHSAIGLLEDDAGLVKLLRGAVKMPSGRFRFQRNVVNGEFVEDALIYRMN